MTVHKEVFNTIYEKNLWGNGSGSGSLPQTTEPYRWFMSNYIRTNRIGRVLDIGCGDWQFSQLMDWSGIDYIGLDVSSVVLENTERYSRPGIQFIEGNAVTDLLPDAELVIIKDVLQHLSNADILTLLPKLARYRHVLITNGFHPAMVLHLNRDIQPGSFRPVNLTREPFNASGNFVFWYDGGEPKAVFLMNGG